MYSHIIFLFLFLTNIKTLCVHPIDQVCNCAQLHFKTTFYRYTKVLKFTNTPLFLNAYHNGLKYLGLKIQ